MFLLWTEAIKIANQYKSVDDADESIKDLKNICKI